jgi:hypothetical protein
MVQLFPYLIEINILLLFFYLPYLLFFRKFTFFGLNRYYFLLTIFCSVILPKIRSVGDENQKSFTGNLLAKIDVGQFISAPSEASVYVIFVIYGFYFFCALMLLRLISILFSIWHIHRKSIGQTFENISYRRIEDSIAPFSFLKSIYINADHHNKEDLKTVLLHEKVHVQQLHSLDILLVELITIIGWFNPAVWKLRSVMRLNLEYLTDQTVLKEGLDFKSYQYSLLSVNGGSQKLKIVASFSSSSIKKRIMMMNKKNSKRIFLICYLFILPFLASALLVNESISNCLMAIAGSSQTSTKVSDAQKQTIYFINNKRVSKSQADQLDTKMIMSVSISKNSVGNPYQHSSITDSIFILTRID